MKKKYFLLFVITIIYGALLVNFCKDVRAVILDNPLATTVNGKITNPSPQQLIGKIINAGLGVVGSLALVMFIYGGFMWMLSGGNQERVKKGKDTLLWASLGLVIIFTSYALVKFVLTTIGAYN